MKGKNKCRILKQIRQRIAEENDIPYVTRECTYRGACSGTCPKCEAELRYLEAELEKRRRLGKTVAVAAVAAGLSLSLTACVPGGSGSGGTSEPTLPTLAPPFSSEPRSTEDPPVIAGMLETVPPETGSTEILEGELPAETDALPPETEPETELMGDVVFLPDGTAAPDAPEVPETTAAPETR